MRSIWSCWSCAVMLLSAILPREAAATYYGKRDTIHRVDKVHVVTQYLAKEKRGDASLCPASYSLCPSSLSGGCCPDRYGCATDSCYATTAGTSTACGRKGYFNCGIDVGGGCCPEGYVCGLNDCSAPAGVTYSQTCPVGYYLCPASYNYGCCQTGYGCALNACWATSPLTWVLTYTTTRSGSEATVTTTTVSTPTQPAGLPTSDTSAAFPKLIPTTEPKAQASAAPSSGGGLTKAQLGGIIGGALVLLVIVILATFIIIKRLNHTARVVQSAKASSSGDVTGTDKKPSTQVSVTQVRVRPTTSEVDAMDYDPLMMTGTSGTPASVSYGRSRSGSELSSQATPFPPSGGRQSVDSHQGSYFDIPRPSNFPGRHANSVEVRSSMDSQSQYQYQNHGRHWSNASDLSTGSGGEAGGSHVGSPLMPAELSNDGGFVPELAGSDTENEERRRSSSVASPRGTSPYMSPNLPRPPLAHQRRRSDGHSRGRSDSTVPPQSLGVVNEGSEMIHGYYGPNNVATGQTNAGLEISYDISSPIAPRPRPES